MSTILAVLIEKSTLLSMSIMYYEVHNEQHPGQETKSIYFTIQIKCFQSDNVWYIKSNIDNF